MQINITGHHINITDGIREAVNQKLQKLGQHFPDITALNIVLTVEKNQQIAETTTHFLGQDLTAKSATEDLYQSIADMASKLTTLLQRHKDKVKSHSHDKPSLCEKPNEATLEAVH